MEQKTEIFISYAWEKQEDGSNWTPIICNLVKELNEKGFNVKIDVRTIKYKDSIKSFMKNLGNGNYIVAVISEKYLKSLNCMYEVLQMLKHPNFNERIFPIITHDAKIFETLKVVEYLKYWDSKIVDLNREAKTLTNVAYASPIFEDIEIMTEIRRIIATFGNEIGDMNVLTPEIHESSNFQDLLLGIEKRIQEDQNNADIKISNELLKNQLSNLTIEHQELQIKYSKSLSEIEEMQLTISSLEQQIMKFNTYEFIEEKLLVYQTKIEAFQNLFGFTRETTRTEIISKIGQPTSITENKTFSFNDMIYEDILNFSYYKNNDKLMAIDIESSVNSTLTFQYLKQLGIEESNVNFLNKHKDEIIAFFGKPTYASHGNYSYETEDFQVNFVCYEHNKELCTRIQTQFV